MQVDIIELRAFYATELGQLVRRTMAGRLRELLPDVTGMSLVGLGYAAPFLGAFREQAERCLAFMPARQGVARWPRRGPGLAALVEAAALPLNDLSVDRFLLVHCLEMADSAEPLLRDVWRTLAPGGRLVVAVPNRRGLWARFEHTPFGQGRPYSRAQLARLLRETGFKPETWEEALWIPPFRSRMLIRSAAAFERAGRFLPAMPPGVLVVQASKQVHGAIPANAEKARKLRPILVPQGAPAPSTRMPRQISSPKAE